MIDMRKITFSIILSVAIIFGCGSRSHAGAQNEWLNFESTSGFRVQYPSYWFKIVATPKNLIIISSSRRIEGVIIARDTQMISVHETAVILNDDYQGDFKNENPGDDVLGYSAIKNPQKTRNSCSKIFIIESTDEVGPDTYYLENHMYCKVGARLFVLDLTQWKNDPLSKGAFAVAIRILESLRTEG